MSNPARAPEPPVRYVLALLNSDASRILQTAIVEGHLVPVFIKAGWEFVAADPLDQACYEAWRAQQESTTT